MIYNYYPGCTLSTKAKKLDRAARRAAEALGFPLVELEEWQYFDGFHLDTEKGLPLFTQDVFSRLA